MFIKKTEEWRAQNADAYFIEVVGDKVVLNDGYTGLQILNEDLRHISTVPLTEEISIYASYSNSDLNVVVLYCPDQDCLVRLSLESMDFSTIPWSGQSILSPVHWWDGADLVVASYDRQFYAVSTESIARVTARQVHERHPAFYDLWALSTTVAVAEFRWSPLSLTHVDGEQIIAHDATGGSAKFVRPHTDYHMIACQGPYAVVVAEDRLDVVAETGKGATLQHQGSQVYLKARFLKSAARARFVVLSGDNADVGHSVVERFEVLE